MKLNPAEKIFNAASKAEGRYAFHGVELRLIEGGAPVLTATDGRKLAQVFPELEDGVDDELAEVLEEAGGSVVFDASALRDAWKGRPTGDRFLRATPAGWQLVNGPTVRPLPTIEGDFPKAEQVVPARVSGRAMTLNVKLLLELAKATGAESLTFEVPEFSKQLQGAAGGQVTTPVRMLARTDAGATPSILVVGAEVEHASEPTDAVAVIMPIKRVF
ncbi:MAG: hypothetical protein GY716_15880 [bacterium]|nr:hypothetical protein [bacterium]